MKSWKIKAAVFLLGLATGAILDSVTRYNQIVAPLPDSRGFVVVMKPRGQEQVEATKSGYILREATCVVFLVPFPELKTEQNLPASLSLLFSKEGIPNATLEVHSEGSPYVGRGLSTLEATSYRIVSAETNVGTLIAIPRGEKLSVIAVAVERGSIDPRCTDRVFRLCQDFHLPWLYYASLGKYSLLGVSLAALYVICALRLVRQS